MKKKFILFIAVLIIGSCLFGFFVLAQDESADVAQPVVEPVAQPVVEPVAQPVVEPVAQPVVQEPTPIAEPAVVSEPEVLADTTPEPVLEDVKTESEALGGYRQARAEELNAQFLQKLGGFMINKRIFSLSVLQRRVESSDKIAGDVKSLLVARYDESINGLKNLKQEIESTSDLAVLKEKVRSIVTEYYIYRVTMPQLQGLISVDRLTGFMQKVGELKERVQVKIDEVASYGGNTTELKSFVVSAEDGLTIARNSLATATEKLTSMQVENPKEAVILKKEAKDNIVTARASLKDSEKNLRRAITTMKDMITASAKKAAEPAEPKE